MIRWLVSLAVALVALGASVRSNTTWRRRTAERQISAVVDGATRYVDMGVVLRVVRMDLECGEELLPSAPPLVIVDEKRFGGMVDTAPKLPEFCGPSIAPVIWYCSEDTAPLILHGNDLPDRMLVYGSEGSGKTTAQAMWAGLRFLEFTGESPVREIGMTAPTEPRLHHILEAIKTLWPASWYRWRSEDKCFYGVNGVRVRLVSTHQQSKAEGSRVQGYNWSAHGGDEMQDQTDYDADIEMRGRSAPRGRYKRFCTCTAKDSPAWRTFRDRALSKKKRWGLRKLLGPRSPFIFPVVWEERKETLTEREYNRRILAQDVGPERMTYHTFSRDENVIPLPAGARDVTRVILRRGGADPRSSLLAGHDPGSLKDVTEFLRAYQLPGQADYVWFVIGELTTKQTTAEQHAVALLDEVRTKWSCNLTDDLDQVHVRADPYGKTKDKPDKDVYRIFAKKKIDIRAAQYAKDGTGTGQIKIDARIDMLCRLFCNAAKKRRLFILRDKNGEPVAPELVASLELSERDEIGRADTDRKDETDRSHWPAALGYALWPFEKLASEHARDENQKEIG